MFSFVIHDGFSASTSNNTFISETGILGRIIKAVRRLARGIARNELSVEWCSTSWTKHHFILRNLRFYNCFLFTRKKKREIER